MEIGFVGLGKMGGNMTLRLVQGSPDGKTRGGHRVVGFAKDTNPDLVGIAGVTIVDSLQKMVAALQPPRTVWVMVPAGAATESVISQLAEMMKPGDTIIDGGNSHYKDSVRRSEGLANRSLGFLDVGTSGGVWGRQEGYCMMVGGGKARHRPMPTHFRHPRPARRLDSHRSARVRSLCQNGPQRHRVWVDGSLCRGLRSTAQGALPTQSQRHRIRSGTTAA